MSDLEMTSEKWHQRRKAHFRSLGYQFWAFISRRLYSSYGRDEYDRKHDFIRDDDDREITETYQSGWRGDVRGNPPIFSLKQLWAVIYVRYFYAAGVFPYRIGTTHTSGKYGRPYKNVYDSIPVDPNLKIARDKAERRAQARRKAS